MQLFLEVERDKKTLIQAEIIEARSTTHPLLSLIQATCVINIHLDYYCYEQYFIVFFVAADSPLHYRYLYRYQQYTL